MICSDGPGGSLTRHVWSGTGNNSALTIRNTTQISYPNNTSLKSIAI